MVVKGGVVSRHRRNNHCNTRVILYLRQYFLDSVRCKAFLSPILIYIQTRSRRHRVSVLRNLNTPSRKFTPPYATPTANRMCLTSPKLRERANESCIRRPGGLRTAVSLSLTMNNCSASSALMLPGRCADVERLSSRP